MKMKMKIDGVCLILSLFIFNLAMAEIPMSLSHNIEIDQNYFMNVVLNGEFVTEKSHSLLYTVELNIYNHQWQDKKICTGVLIANDIVLTAGHCLTANDHKILIKFGLGGKSGYTNIIESQIYKSVFSSATILSKTSTNSDNWINGKLNINLDLQKEFYKKQQNRRDFVNFNNNESGLSTNDFQDFAVVRIPRLPRGYKPIQLFHGLLYNRKQVIQIGYGLNSLNKSENATALRTATAFLSGHFTLVGPPAMGLQTFSPTKQQACDGDSGGPLVSVEADGTEVLIGTLIGATNNCGNANWYTNIGYFINEINQLIAEVRSIQTI